MNTKTIGAIAFWAGLAGVALSHAYFLTMGMPAGWEQSHNMGMLVSSGLMIAGYVLKE